MSGENFILSGPSLDFSVPEGSLGKYVFECLKKRDPQHISLVDGITGKSLQTSHTLQNSLKAAKVLENIGLQKGDVLAIIVENTINYYMPLLGAFYKGVTAHLLNPLYSIGELRHALSISKPKLIICSEVSVKNVVEVQKELYLENVKLLYLENPSNDNYNMESLENLIENIAYIEPESFTPETLDSSDQGALILMSSGTTGLPKGVLLTHKNLTTSFEYFTCKEFIDVTINDSTVLIVPLFHILGAIIHTMSIAVGMKLVMLNRFKPDTFLECIQKYQPTKLYMVPPLLLFLVKSPLVSNYDISSINDIMVGGAAIGKELHAEAIEKLKHAHVRIAYGITETGACAIQNYGKTEIGSVGRLVPNILAKVCDCETKQNLAPLEVGEVCFKGPTVMKEYIGNESATKECFDQEGFYHTGDLGYYDENGNIYLIDRIKELIKYKGFQVPPAELETLILTHPAVKDCGVIGIPNERAGQLPLAYVVKQDGIDVTEEDVVNYVEERISLQKRLYGGVRFTEEIPKNAAGKILRRKLIEIYNASL